MPKSILVFYWMLFLCLHSLPTTRSHPLRENTRTDVVLDDKNVQLLKRLLQSRSNVEIPAVLINESIKLLTEKFSTTQEVSPCTKMNTERFTQVEKALISLTNTEMDNTNAKKNFTYQDPISENTDKVIFHLTTLAKKYNDINIDYDDLKLIRALIQNRSNVEVPAVFSENSLELPLQDNNTPQIKSMNKNIHQNLLIRLSTEYDSTHKQETADKDECLVRTFTSTLKPMISLPKTELEVKDATLVNTVLSRLKNSTYFNVYDVNTTKAGEIFPFNKTLVIQGSTTLLRECTTTPYTFPVLNKPTMGPKVNRSNPLTVLENLDFANMTNSHLMNQLADIANFSDSWENTLMRNSANVTYMNIVGYNIAASVGEVGVSLYKTLKEDLKDVWAQRHSVMQDIKVNLLGLSSSEAVTQGRGGCVT